MNATICCHQLLTKYQGWEEGFAFSEDLVMVTPPHSPETEEPDDGTEGEVNSPILSCNDQVGKLKQERGQLGRVKR